jgi:putative SOS response-associated peptidase YedK
MCGRFTLRTPLSKLVRQFGVLDVPELPLRYNIAPTQEIAAVRAAGDGRELVLLRWGLIPSWADDPRVGNRAINARSETADTKPAFHDAFRQRRCLVVADGFYEWKADGRTKQPYYIQMADGSAFAFAGLWERWRRKGQAIESCTILTTDANERVAALHDRMPVILTPHEYELWLDPAVQEPERLKPLLRSCKDELLTMHPVGPEVNRPTNDSVECIAAVERQATLF